MPKAGSASRGAAATRGGSGGGGAACPDGFATRMATRSGSADGSDGAAGSLQEAPAAADWVSAAWNGCFDVFFFDTTSCASGEPATARSIDSLVAW